MLKSKDILGDKGLLASHLKNFHARPEQLAMAEFVEARLHDQDVGVVEAGTGTGKTFAYLVPILLSGLKAIVSTGTKNLQDQLFFKDLPLILEALKSSHKVALLKGRANYLCQYRLQRALAEGMFLSKQVVHDLHVVDEWSHQTDLGDISELSAIQEDASIWSQVTSTSDNCLGQDCPFYEDCFVTKARMKAQAADILVVNHHLFMADLALKGEGYGELLPEVSAVIFDEAHHLAKVATQFFGESLSSRQLLDLVRDIKQEYVLTLKDTPALNTAAERLELAVRELRSALGEANQRGDWSEIASKKPVNAKLNAVFDELETAKSVLSQMSGRTKGLVSCEKRAAELFSQLKFLTGEVDQQAIHWYETFAKNFSFHMTPISIAEFFIQHMQQYDCAWIFTSATIAIRHDFHYFSANLGLDAPKSLQLDSPFNFEQQAMLYIPLHLPLPQSFHYTAKMVEAILPVLRASQGRAFILFTSFKALYEAEALLRDRVTHPLLVQGELPKTELLNQFREMGNAVLLGTNSFWEGVDVRGEALSCVIIDKLPFASPGDPILKARLNKMRELGEDPFNEFQLPQAIIALKQGVGRLIRDAHDRGVLVVCDPRLFGRSYGRLFLESLPRMPYTQQIEEVEQFFSKGVDTP